MRKPQRKQLRLIAVPLAQAALQLGALQQQLIAARELDLDRYIIVLASAEALGLLLLLAAHEQNVDKKDRGVTTRFGPLQHLAFPNLARFCTTRLGPLQDLVFPNLARFCATTFGGTDWLPMVSPTCDNNTAWTEILVRFRLLWGVPEGKEVVLIGTPTAHPSVINVLVHFIATS
jgi:hypothetical protein